MITANYARKSTEQNDVAEKGSKATDTDKKPKRRRARGSGSVHLMGRIYWIAYFGIDGILLPLPSAGRKRAAIGFLVHL